MNTKLTMRERLNLMTTAEINREERIDAEIDEQVFMMEEQTKREFVEIRF